MQVLVGRGGRRPGTPRHVPTAAFVLEGQGGKSRPGGSRLALPGVGEPVLHVSEQK